MSDNIASAVPEVTIFTDGACLGNPGPGGYAALLMCKGKEKELSAGFRLTTNNRMELMGAIVGLQALNTRCRVTVYSDSRYLVDGVMLGWARKWKGNGWRRNKGELAVNIDLWERLLEICDRHDVTFEWIRGHNDNPLNERCDRLAEEAARGSHLQEDDGYGAARTLLRQPAQWLPGR